MAVGEVAAVVSAKPCRTEAAGLVGNDLDFLSDVGLKRGSVRWRNAQVHNSNEGRFHEMRSSKASPGRMPSSREARLALSPPPS